MKALWTETKRAFREAGARPGFAMMVVLALGLGIGLNTAIFSIVHAVLLKSLPYDDPARLVRVWEARPRMGPEADEIAAFSMDHYRAWRASNDVFSTMAVYEDASFNLTGGPEPIRIEAQRVSPALFPMLGVEPLLGRVFAQEEETPGRDRVALLSHGLWQRLFGSDRAIVGTTLRLDGVPFTVVGVMPPEFQFPHPAVELWVPLADVAPPPAHPGEMRIELVPVIARLAPGVSLAEAEASGQAFLASYRGESAAPPGMPDIDEGVSIRLTSLHDQLARPLRPAVLVLFGAVSFVLLIVCANVASLFLSRAQERQPEMAVRSALGAGRGRLAAQLFFESFLYAAAGAALGLVVAYWGIRIFVGMAPSSSPLLEDVGLDVAVLGFNVALTGLTALLVGTLPALRASRVDVVSGLKGLAGFGRRGRRSRNVLAVAEVALALVLFVAAGLLLRSFVALTRTDPGYEPRDVLTFRLSLPEAKYSDGASRRAFFERLDERLNAVPGVVAAGLVNVLPLDDARMITMLAIEGRPPVADRMQMPRASVRLVSPRLFEAMGVRLLSGRRFPAGSAAAAPELVVNEALARRYFPDVSPVSERVRRMGEIVGVVADVRQEGVDAEPEPELYLDYRSVADALGVELAATAVAVRYDPRLPGTLEAVEAAVRELDPELPLADVRTMESRLADAVARPRLYAALLSFFAAIALVLAATGVGSVVSFQVAEHTRENGLRVALGASSKDVLLREMRGGLRILAVGLSVGLLGAALLSRTLSGFLYRVEPFDLLTFVAVSVMLALAVTVATAIPARRATRVDPMTALRYE